MLLELHPDAKLDVLEAADWYDARAPGLGDDLVAEFEGTLSTILEAPRTWMAWPGAPVLDPPIRRVLLWRFSSYAVAFRVLPDRVFVLALVHSSREPFYWAHRTGPAQTK
ncbi:MAG TPA: type II toxin-antitoxin system RelE/ParE family toxin [Candidatus Krumholzibacteria bacterium]